MKEIIEKIEPGGLITGWRRVGKTIASVIEGDSSESGIGQGYHLVPPRVPYLRETVQEYNGVSTWRNKKEEEEERTVFNLLKMQWCIVILTASYFSNVELEISNVDELVFDSIHNSVTVFFSVVDSVHLLSFLVISLMADSANGLFYQIENNQVKFF